MKSREIRKEEWIIEARGEHGQALVETALTIPLLLLLLLGAAELARVAYAAIEISNAARAAVQYAAQSEGNMNDTPGITTAAQNDAANLTGVMVTVSLGNSCSDSSTYNALTKGCTGTFGQLLPNVTVTTSVNFDPLLYMPYLPNTIALHGQATEDCVDCL